MQKVSEVLFSARSATHHGCLDHELPGLACDVSAAIVSKPVSFYKQPQLCSFSQLRAHGVFVILVFPHCSLVAVITVLYYLHVWIYVCEPPDREQILPNYKQEHKENTKQKENSDHHSFSSVLLLFLVWVQKKKKKKRKLMGTQPTESVTECPSCTKSKGALTHEVMLSRGQRWPLPHIREHATGMKFWRMQGCNTNTQPVSLPAAGDNLTFYAGFVFSSVMCPHKHRAYLEENRKPRWFSGKFVKIPPHS